MGLSAVYCVSRKCKACAMNLWRMPVLKEVYSVESHSAIKWVENEMVNVITYETFDLFYIVHLNLLQWQDF